MQRVTSAGMILHLQRWVSSVGTTRGSKAMSLLVCIEVMSAEQYAKR